MTPCAPTRSAPRLALVAIVRNEAPYLLEWIAHHQALGVRDLVIADNVSQDGTSELLEALDALGEIRRLPFPDPPDRAPQLPAYAAMLETLSAAARDDPDAPQWAAIIDADEYLVPEPLADAPVADWLGAAIAPVCDRAGVGAIAVNWALYGSSWLASQGAGLVTERFVRRAHAHFASNHHYKTLLRLRAWHTVSGNPHHMHLQPGWRLVHPDGSDARPHPYHGWGLSQEVVWSRLRLNHYIVKSREEFDARKARNGSAATRGRVKGDDYFRAHDRNDTRDACDVRLIEATRAKLSRLTARLQATGCPLPPPATQPPRYLRPFEGVQGHVDRIVREGEAGRPRLRIRGWTMNGDGLPAAFFAIEGPQGRRMIADYEPFARPDIQRHFPMAHPRCGFELLLDLDTLATGPGLDDLADTLRIRAGDDPNRLSSPLPIPPQVLATLR